MINVGLLNPCRYLLQKASSLLSLEKWLFVTLMLTDSYDLVKFCHHSKELPDILVVDIDMRKIDGVTLTSYLNNEFPEIRVIAVSTCDEINVVQEMLFCGARGYLTAEHLPLLPSAISHVATGSVYLDPMFNGKTLNGYDVNGIRTPILNQVMACGLTRRELTFTILNATELDFSEISDIMAITRKSVENLFYRVAEKFSVNSRNALTIASIRSGLVKIAHASANVSLA